MKVEIVKQECGSVMGEYGNTCFFNSLKNSVKEAGYFGMDYDYSGFLSLGGWDFDSQKGKMIDTHAHEEQLNRLANTLCIRIAVYTEVAENMVNPDSVSIFGDISLPVHARIVKVHGSPHFNSMTFEIFNPRYKENDSTINRDRLMAEVKVEKSREDAKKTAELTALEEERQQSCEKAMEEERLKVKAETRRKVLQEAENKVSELTMKISRLEGEIIGWGETLTSLGREPAVEKCITDLCKTFRDAMEIRNKFVAALSKHGRCVA
jgi:hypothetical protein